MAISFHFQDVKDSLDQKRKHKAWIKQIIEVSKKQPGEISYIFCTDDFLLGLNRTHLNHDTFTDIITFDQSDIDQELSADIFISTERVMANALKFDVQFDEELRRVMIHGILHILGQSDKTAKDKEKMRLAEDLALQKFQC